jgi:hypothetical protein
MRELGAQTSHRSLGFFRGSLPCCTGAPDTAVVGVVGVAQEGHQEVHLGAAGFVAAPPAGVPETPGAPETTGAPETATGAGAAHFLWSGSTGGAGR